MGSALDRLQDDVAACLRRHEPAEPRALVAAVSGGADSTALALALAALVARGMLRRTIVVAHIDHGFPVACRDHAAHVRRLAAELGLPFALAELGLDASASEAVMRARRYAALTDIARAHAADTLLTAHHADDDLETVLFRMLRGTGPAGLAGIPERRDHDGLVLLRPLLRRSRAELRAAVAETGRTWVEDPLNADLGKRRNELRHGLIPGLREALGGSLDETVLQIARSARAVRNAVEDAAAAIWQRALAWHGTGRLELRAVELTDLDDLLLDAVLGRAHGALAGAAPTRHWLRRARALCREGGRLDSGPLAAERCRGTVVLARGAELTAAPPDAVEVVPAADAAPRSVQFGETEWVVHARARTEVPLDPPPSAAGPARALLDANAGPFPWRLRALRPGERARTLGAGGRVELRKLLAARGVPALDRRRRPLLVDARDRVLWVCGVEVADLAKVTAKTAACVEARLERV